MSLGGFLIHSYKLCLLVSIFKTHLIIIDTWRKSVFFSFVFSWFPPCFFCPASFQALKCCSAPFHIISAVFDCISLNGFFMVALEIIMYILTFHSLFRIKIFPLKMEHRSLVRHPFCCSCIRHYLCIH